MPSSKPVFAIFSGGGVKAAGFVGALQEAEKRLTYLGVGGTSGGAIVATLLACGYSPKELEHVLFDAPYPEILKPRWLRFLFNHRKGIFDHRHLLKWLRETIAAKIQATGRAGVTFGDLSNQKGIPLKIVATNVTAQDIVVFSVDSHAGVEIARAVLASCSFPIFFPPVPHSEGQLVDGGVMCNFPMWLFDMERREAPPLTSVLGFAVVPNAEARHDLAPISHWFSLFECILVAQDRVQERYLATTRLADVIRIRIPPTATFERGLTDQHRTELLDSGKRAAIEYFENAPESYGERMDSPPSVTATAAEDLFKRGLHAEALSWIVRLHILRGGVAKDSGLAGGRTFVKYYINLMEATTDSAKLNVLSKILVQKIKSLPATFDRIVGMQKGNILLAAKTAHLLDKPLVVVKSDMSYRMGPPFDGEVIPGESVILVDDVGSDASMLLYAINQLKIHHVQVLSVVVLIARKEGDAREELWSGPTVRLHSVCTIDDTAIRDLVEGDDPFP